MRRRVAVGVAASIVVVAVVLAVARHGSSRRPATEGAAAAVRSPSTTAVAAVATHDVAGAVATVVDWERRSAVLATGSEADLLAAESSIAADATRAQLIAANVAQFRRVRGALPAEDLAYRVAVLATRASAHTADAVEVTVWRVGVLTVAGRGSSAEWATVTYELVWERAAWRLLSEAAVAGPVPPAGAVTPAGELVSRVDSFSSAAAQ